MIRLSNSNVFRLLPGNSLITLRSPYSALSSVKIISEAFYEIVKVYEKNRGLITNNIENYSKLVKEVLINRFHFKMQLSATRQNSGEFIFQQDCHSAQDTLVF